ncbi:MAG: hypothetical protein KGQ59_00820 [Bdellovibrionales bacterium]|nr:hypothetical protein [Bdellovibrionales bacterium]
MLPVVEVRRHFSHAPWTYESLDLYQRQIADRLLAQPNSLGRVLISELAPVITLGRRPCGQDVLLSPSELQALGLSLYQTDRGGRATYHGPGQWVIFVVDRLDRMTGDRRGVRRVVEGLLAVAQSIGERFLGSDVHLRDGDEAGVWTSQGKLASVGVQVHEGILLHGLALNGYRTEQSFRGLRPCGLDVQADFLFRTPSEDEFLRIPALVSEELVRHFWIQG